VSSDSTSAPSGARARFIDVLLLGAIWGSSFLFLRIAAAEFGALPTAAMRMGIALLLLLPLALARGQGAALLTHWKAAFVMGLFNSAIPFALFAFALLSLNSGMAAVLNATTPMFGALVAWAWFGERPGGWRVFGLALGFGGVALLAGHDAGLAQGAHAGAALWAVPACLAGCLCYGIAAGLTRRHLQGVPVLATAAGSLIGATLVLALPALWLWPAQNPSARAWLALLALGGACTALAYVLFFRLIATAGPARALTVTFLTPVFALVYGALFLDERITPWMLSCTAVIVVGVALSTGFARASDRS
jgi:drug/metabolite transporter (DMT)-like permease